MTKTEIFIAQGILRRCDPHDDYIKYMERVGIALEDAQLAPLGALNIAQYA